MSPIRFCDIVSHKSPHTLIKFKIFGKDGNDVF